MNLKSSSKSKTSSVKLITGPSVTFFLLLKHPQTSNKLRLTRSHRGQYGGRIKVFKQNHLVSVYLSANPDFTCSGLFAGFNLVFVLAVMLKSAFPDGCLQLI